MQLQFWNDFLSIKDISKQIDTILNKDSKIKSKWFNYCQFRIKLLLLNIKNDLASIHSKYTLKNCDSFANIGTIEENSTHVIDTLQVNNNKSDTSEKLVEISNAEKYFICYCGINCLFTWDNGMINNFISAMENINITGQQNLKNVLKNYLENVISCTKLISKSSITSDLFNNKNGLDSFVEQWISGIDCGKGKSVKFEDIKYYLVNHFVFYLYQHLVADSNSSNSRNSNFKKFFTFFWNFCVYNVCYPWGTVPDGRNKESFYILQFLRYASINDNSDDDDDKRLILNNVYFGNSLLHYATYENMYYYCQLLVKNGANIDLENKFHESCHYHAIGKPMIKSLFSQAQTAMVRTVSNDLELVESKSNESTAAVAVTTRSKTNTQVNNSLGNSAEIESHYWLLKKQRVFCDMFLLFLGCDVSQNFQNKFPMIPNIGKIPLRATMHQRESKYFENELFYDYSQYNQCNKIFEQSPKEAQQFMARVVNNIINLLKQYVAVSDDLLVLSFEYCCRYDSSLRDQFVNVLKNICQNCLSIKTNHDKDKDKEKDKAPTVNSDNDQLQTRNVAWYVALFVAVVYLFWIIRLTFHLTFSVDIALRFCDIFFVLLLFFFLMCFSQVQ